MKCAEVSKFVYVYLDGEFEPRECAEFEEHVRVCDPCHRLVAFERSFHGLVRSRLEQTPAPDGLRTRVLAAIAEEETREGGLTGRLARLPLAMKAAPALAAAALVALLVWPQATTMTGPPGDTTRMDMVGASLGAAPSARGVKNDSDAKLDDLVTQAVAVHEVAPPSEVEGDRHQIEEFVASRLPSARPPLPDSPDLRLVGARQARFGGHPAVLYTYDYKGRRVTAVQYADDTDKPRFRRAAFTDRRGRYSVLLLRDRDRGVTNSFVGDLDERDLLELIPASYQR